VNSLATAAASAQTEVRLIARNNEVLATKRTDSAGHAVFEAGFARGEGGMTPALFVATDSRGDYAFLSLIGPAFDFSDRGVAGRPVPAGLDAFVYTERGVYRTGETVHVTAFLRDPTGLAAAGAPLTLVIERPDGVEYRRAVVADQGLGGRNLDVAIAPTATTGTWRVRAFSDPKRPDRRSELHGRGLRARPHGIRPCEQDQGGDPGQAVRDHGRRPLPLRRAR
jgi:alpha-2-macroglobulin